jgi:hypothetical protein
MFTKFQVSRRNWLLAPILVLSAGAQGARSAEPMPPGVYEEPDWGPALVRLQGQRFEIVSVDSSPARQVIDVFRVTGTFGGECLFIDPEDGETEPCELRPGPEHFDLVLEGELSRFRRLPEGQQPAAATAAAARESSGAAQAAPVGSAEAAAPPAALVPAAPLDTAQTGSAELQAGQRYEAGTRVEVSSLGVSFVVPRDWFGGRPPGQEAFVLGSSTKRGVGLVFVRSGVSASQVAALLAEPQDMGSGVVLHPVGAPQVAGQRVSARYAGGVYAGQALALVGPAGNGIAFAYFGPQEEAGYHAALLEGLAGSARLQTPRAPAGLAGEWTSMLSGRMFKHFDRYGTGGGGYTSERTLHLCSDGSYLYQGDSSFGINVPGAGAGGGGRSQAAGRWRIDEANQQEAILVLEASDGSASRPVLSRDASQSFHLDRNRVYWDRSDACP